MVNDDPEDTGGPGEMEMMFRAPRGPKGEKGDRGAEGMLPRGARRSLLARDCVIVLLLLLNFLFTARYVNTTQAGQQHQQAAQQAAQRRAGAMVEQKLCTDLGTMAQIHPPPGAPSANPSRAYEQAEHRAWQGLFTGIGCH